MELCLKRQPLFFALAVCIAFSVVFAGTIVADTHDCADTHNNIEENCLDCLHIEIAKSFLKTFKAADSYATHLLIQFPSFEKNTECSILSRSPIMLKDRLNAWKSISLS